MGLLQKGKWVDKWYDTSATGGKFVREDAIFRNWITDDVDDVFPAESGRYHLYVSLACPWAHRTLIFRQLKGLTKHIGVSVVEPHMLENGWEFADGGDELYNSRFMHQIYTKAKSDYSGRVTVPVLWDKQQETIVSNESADIIRMFNSAFNHITGNDVDYYPLQLQEEIEEINASIYDNINNGVYRTGFATTQSAYEQAFAVLFSELDRVEKRLQQQRYLVGDCITEADWRLFTTLIRFDAVYFGHFKCNLRRIEDYPAISNYLRALYQTDGIAPTVNFEHIKQHYYYSHDTINPTRVVPLGPDIDFWRSHNR